MEIIDYFSDGAQERWLAQIGRCDWDAGRYLHKLLSDGTLADAVGENPAVLLLADGGNLVSFCTLSQKDDIQPTELTPWIGFVYTFPQYRGRRRAGTLLAEAERRAGDSGAEHVFISTDCDGLYEKYGYEFYRLMTCISGGHSRVYRAKSHLLAALLRCGGVPTGFCYQKVILGDASDPVLVLHGLNAVYVEERRKWIRLDARGNRSGVNAQFSLEEERLAFPVRAEKGERDIFAVFPAPDRNVLKALRAAKTRAQLCNSLPSELDYDG